MTFLRFADRVRPEVVVDGCVETALLTDSVGGFESTTLFSAASPYWWQHFGVLNTWAISATDPRSGTKRLAGTGGSSSSLRLLGLVSGSQASPNASTYYTHPAVPGQLWTWRGYYKGPGGPAAGIVFDDSDRPTGTGSSVGSSTVNLTASPTYSEFSVSLEAPAGAAFVRVNFFRLSGSASSDQYDDWQLIVCE